MSAAVHTEAVEAPAPVTEESAGMHSHSTDGKRFNRVNTLARVHYPTPKHLKGHTMPRYVHVKQEINQVSIVAEEMVKPAKKRQEDDDEDDEEMAWLLDDTCDDDVENADIFEKVQKWYHKRFDDGGGHLTVAVCGGHSSGKTHTLLGPAGDAGILPRFLEDSVEYLTAASKSGKEPTVLLSAFLLEGEDLIDLFNPFGQEAKEEDEEEEVVMANGKKKTKKNTQPPKKHKKKKKKGDDDDDDTPPRRINRRVEQSDSTLFRTEASCLGSTIVEGVEVMACTGLGSDSVSEEARKLLSTAVRTASVIVAQSNRIFYGANMVVRVILVDNPTGKEKDRCVRVVNFVELESFGCPDACTPNEDRLNGSSTRHQGTRLVRDAGRHLPRNATLSMMHVDKSFLTFYLQDSLFYRSDCYIIGCVRAVEGTVDENFRTLDFMNRIDVLSDDEAPVIEATLLELVHEGLEAEAKTAERWADKHAVNQERAAAKASRRLARGLEDPSKMPAADAADFHHRHHHSDKRDFAQVYRNKKVAMLALREQLNMSAGALKKSHTAMKGVLSQLVHWLELWGITRTRKPIWPGLTKLRDPTFTCPQVSVAPGDYLVPLSANGLPTLHGWVGLTFGYTVVTNMSWDAEVHVCEKRMHMASTSTPISPALKMALSAALHEADDDDDEEAFERFAKAAKDNGKHTIKEGAVGKGGADDDGEQLEEGEGELFRTLLVHGEDLELEHCVVQCVAGEIKIRTILRENGTHTSIHVNGEDIKGVSALVDGDIVSFGTTQFFQVRQVVPGGATAVVGDEEDEEDLSDSVDSDDEYAVKIKAAADAAKAVGAGNNTKKKAVSTRRLAVESDLSLFEKACRQVMVKSLMDAWRHQASELIHLQHMEVDRPMAAIAKTADKPPVPPAYEISKEDAEDALLDGMPPVTQARLCEMGLGGRAMSMLSLTMARDCIARLQLKQVTPDEYARRKRHSGALCWAMRGKLYAGEILVKQIEGSEEVGLWLWARFVFMERYIQAHQMYRRFLHMFDVAGPGSSKPQVLSLLEEQYPHEEDPFLDMPGDELIGVGYVYLDALQYMLDIDENVPLVNFKGRASGSLRILARVWLDKVTVEPTYVSADEEMRMDKYYDHTCHIRVHLSSLSGIPSSLACKTHAEFKFFFHGKKYRTPDHAGYAPNPFINHTMAITQKITPDFLDFLQSGSLEIEVWGKHASPLSIRHTKDPDSRHQCRHLHLGEPKYVEVVESDGEEDDKDGTDDEGNDSDAEDVDTLKAKVEVLQGDLETVNRQLQRATKAVEAYEKKKSWGFGGKKKGGASKFDDEDGSGSCGCVLM